MAVQSAEQAEPRLTSFWVWFSLATALHRQNFGKQGEKGGDFFERSDPQDKKILPEPCLEKSLYIESEKRETCKSVKKVDISVVSEISICGVFATYEIKG